MVLYLSERGYISKPGESPGAPRFPFLFEIGFLRERSVKSDQSQLTCSIHQVFFAAECSGQRASFAIYILSEYKLPIGCFVQTVPVVEVFCHRNGNAAPPMSSELKRGSTGMRPGIFIL